MNQIISDNLNLADIIHAVQARPDLSASRKRDLVASVRWVAKAKGENPEAIKLNLRDAAGVFRDVCDKTLGLSVKRQQNLKSDFSAAVKVSGLAKLLQTASMPQSEEWRQHLQMLEKKELRDGLSRFSRYCTATKIRPADVTDEVFEGFLAELESRSLVRSPHKSQIVAIRCWNRACDCPGWTGRRVTPVRVGREQVKIDLGTLPDAFLKDMNAYLEWCACASPLDEGARARALAPATIKMRRNELHSAIDAAAKEGVEVHQFTSLKDCVDLRIVRTIFQHFYLRSDGKPNALMRGVSITLVAIAKEWVKVSEADLAELKRLRSKLPTIPYGLTDKNKATLASMDNPQALGRLLDLPGQLWKQACSNATPAKRRLPYAQMALMIELLLCCPIRLRNVTDLEFGNHIAFPAGKDGLALLSIEGSETKNGVPIVAELSKPFSDMARVYRDKLVPQLCGEAYATVFIDRKGRKKLAASVGALFTDIMIKHGLNITPHQMRHIAAKLILDSNPGAIYQVSQLLGHKSIKITQAFYAGIDTNRAVNFMSALVEKQRDRRQQEASVKKSRHRT